jgi:protein-S-isoprenylcysteine O-methyltransferase Ste14
MDILEMIFYLFEAFFLLFLALFFFLVILNWGYRLLGKGSLFRKLSQQQPQQTSTANAIVHLLYRVEFHVVVFTGIFALFIGLSNIQHSPLLWGFLATIFFFRCAEVFSPAAHVLRQYRKEEDHSRWTTWVIGASFLTNLVAPILEYRYKHSPEVPPVQWWNWLGLLLLIIGSALRLWAIHQAGESFTPHLKVEVKQKIVITGPYAYMRHPSYLGTFFSYLGIAILFSSVLASIALVVFVVPALIWRIIKEEKLLASHFNEAWKKYQSQTPWRLIPGVW